MTDQSPVYNVNQIIAGFIGAVIMVLKKKGHIQWIPASIAVLTGTASATYLTPLVGQVLHDKDPTHLCGFAFLLGVLGLRGVELITERVIVSKVKE